MQIRATINVCITYITHSVLRQYLIITVFADKRIGYFIFGTQDMANILQPETSAAYLYRFFLFFLHIYIYILKFHNISTADQCTKDILREHVQCT